MNPFQKLKLTIDRIGLEYIPESKQDKIEGQSVYRYTKTNEIQQNDSVPYFKTQGPRQKQFKKISFDQRNQQIEQLKAVYQNQQRNLIEEISLLNKKLQQYDLKYENLCIQNQRLKSESESYERQIKNLRAAILQVEQKSARKLSQSNVFERQRKLKEQIDRINITMMQIAKDLNTEKTTKKSLQKQIEQSKLEYQSKENSMTQQIRILKSDVQALKEQLAKRTELLQHSIKSSTDQKLVHKQTISQIRQKYELKIESLSSQLGKARQQIYNLKNDLTASKFEIDRLVKQKQTEKRKSQKILNQLNEAKSHINRSTQNQKNLKEKLQQLKLQTVYYQQQLEQERSNTKVKVVEVRDESLEMELQMYKKQCKQLLKEKSILETVRKDKSDYTIVSENQIVLNKSN